MGYNKYLIVTFLNKRNFYLIKTYTYQKKDIWGQLRLKRLFGFKKVLYSIMKNRRRFYYLILNTVFKGVKFMQKEYSYMANLMFTKKQLKLFYGSLRDKYFGKLGMLVKRSMGDIVNYFYSFLERRIDVLLLRSLFTLNVRHARFFIWRRCVFLDDFTIIHIVRRIMNIGDLIVVNARPFNLFFFRLGADRSIDTYKTRDMLYDLVLTKFFSNSAFGKSFFYLQKFVPFISVNEDNSGSGFLSVIYRFISIFYKYIYFISKNFVSILDKMRDNFLNIDEVDRKFMVNIFYKEFFKLKIKEQLINFFSNRDFLYPKKDGILKIFFKKMFFLVRNFVAFEKLKNFKKGFLYSTYLVLLLTIYKAIIKKNKQLKIKHRNKFKKFSFNIKKIILKVVLTKSLNLQYLFIRFLLKYIYLRYIGLNKKINQIRNLFFKKIRGRSFLKVFIKNFLKNFNFYIKIYQNFRNKGMLISKKKFFKFVLKVRLLDIQKKYFSIFSEELEKNQQNIFTVNKINYGKKLLYGIEFFTKIQFVKSLVIFLIKNMITLNKYRNVKRFYEIDICTVYGLVNLHLRVKNFFRILKPKVYLFNRSDCLEMSYLYKKKNYRHWSFSKNVFNFFKKFKHLYFIYKGYPSYMEVNYRTSMFVLTKTPSLKSVTYPFRFEKDMLFLFYKKKAYF